MPQPYLPHFDHITPQFSPHAIAHRPAFIANYACILSQWAYVESELGLLFGALIGTRTPQAHRLYLLLRRWQHQREALDTAASSLTDDLASFYQATIVECGGLEKKRNDLVHSLFGVCEEDHDLLFALNVENHVLWKTDSAWGVDGTDPSSPKVTDLYDKMYVYRPKELHDMFFDMHDLFGDLVTLNRHLRNPGNPIYLARFRERLALPRVQQRIALLKGPQNGSEPSA